LRGSPENPGERPTARAALSLYQAHSCDEPSKDGTAYPGVSWPVSVAQNRDRVEPRHPARRDVAGKRRNPREQQCCCRERQRVPWADAEDERIEETREAEPGCSANH